ncbi:MULTISPECIES: hypothetical protein [unclassified Eubacterium (in: firmicutes)]|uniref:hypothetical protein n=1 Tax=unclassified Eubacterium (in: firmicutes) TaxID=2624479 RepID=UPI000E4C712B|nr:MULTISPECIES: hypothetical protein [unclassified Eubacterium (in: firmicutes)]RGF52857.1 hypothetical protein DW006_00065 [Eubacterium sp. AF36-5BH]
MITFILYLKIILNMVTLYRRKDEYIKNPPKELLHKTFSEDEVNKKESCINSDKICDYIAKEFNVKRFIYETGSERSTEKDI